METRAHHVIIGVFTLLVAVGILFFIYWAGQFGTDRHNAYYEAVFDVPVTGLTTGSPVLYLGIKVGEVAGFRIDPEDPNKVHVILKVEIRDDIKIREDTVASLELQGVTGTAVIQLSGGKTTSAVLPQVRSPLGKLPQLQTRQTGLSALVAQAPEVFGQAQETLYELKRMLRENRENINTTMKNVARITSAFAERDEEIKRILSNAAKASDQLPGLTKDLRSVTKRMDNLLKNEGRTALANVGTLAADGSRLIRENEDAVHVFTERGLAQFADFITEARRLVASLGRVADRLERDPSSFLTGRAQAAEIEPPKDGRPRPQPQAH